MLKQHLTEKLRLKESWFSFRTNYHPPPMMAAALIFFTGEFSAGVF